MPAPHPRLLGQIALREGCLTPEQLEECLAIQATTQPPPRLGQILLEKGHLLPEELRSLLDLQSLKVEAIPTSPKKGGLAGALALKLGYVTAERLAECIVSQDDPAAGESPTLLGQILLRNNYITTDQFLDLLRRQKTEVASCPACRTYHDVRALREGTRFLCARCAAVVAPAPPAAEPPPAPPTPPPSAASPAPASGAAPRYEMQQKIGQGGMGEVWKAYDRQLKRIVALKFMKNDDRDELARFGREAQMAAKLIHPNIAAVYDVGRQDGRPYISMQYVDGLTLQSAPREDLRVVVEMARQAADGLQYAHDQGVIHRDLKPANIMVTGSRGPSSPRPGPASPRSKSALQVYVMDFGLAKMMNVDSSLSLSGVIIGTPSYMSPEQAQGSPTIDARADVYSLGATLYEMLTDRPPFVSSSIFELLKDVAGKDVTPVRKINPKVPADLETIVLKCLEKDPARRYATAQELSDDLGRWLDGEAILASRPSVLYRVRKYVARRRAAVAAGALAAVLALAAGGWMIVSTVRTSSRVKDLIASADAASAAGDLKAARDAYRSALDLAPDNAAAMSGFETLDRRLKARESEREAARTAAEADRKAQDEAMKLLEAGRPALDRAGRYLYRKEANYQELLKRVEVGQKLIEQAVQKAPGLALGHHLMGRAWEIQGREDRAEASWRKAIELDGTFGPARFALGRLLLRRSATTLWAVQAADRDQVLPEVERLATQGADEIEAAQGRSGFDDDLQRDLAAALLCFARKDHDGTVKRANTAIERFGSAEGVEEFHWLLGMESTGAARIAAHTRALEICPKFTLALVSRSGARQSTGDADGAIEDSNAAIQVNPNLPEAYYNRGAGHSAKGEADAAIADYTEALRLDPEGRRPFGAYAFSNRGNLRWMKDDLEGALADLNEAVRRRPHWVPYRLTRGRLRQQLGDDNGALEDFTESVRLDPRSAEALADRGVGLAAKGDRAAALKDVEAALSLDPACSRAFLLRGQLHWFKGELDEARADAEQAVKGDPSLAAAYYLRARVRHSKGDVDGAMADYLQAIKANPRYSEAFLDLARARRTKNDLDGAIEASSQAIKLNPRFPEAHLNRGNAKAQKGDFEAAIADFEQALRLNPSYALAYLSRGSARLEKGDGRGGVADFEKALEVAPKEWPYRAQVEARLKELKRNP